MIEAHPFDRVSGQFDGVIPCAPKMKVEICVMIEHIKDVNDALG